MIHRAGFNKNMRYVILRAAMEIRMRHRRNVRWRLRDHTQKKEAKNLAAPNFSPLSSVYELFLPPLQEERLNLLSAHGIEHIAGPQPAFARDADTVAHEIDAVDGVGIGIDGNFHALITRPVEIAPVEIEARGMGIDLNTDAVLGCRVDNGVHV